MALVDNAWYINFGNGSSTGYYAVTQWATGAAIAAGVLRRQLAAPAVGSERVFVCVVAGTTHATTEPTWIITRGGKTTDNTVTWQECTGIAALNGDATNTPSWTISATPPGGVKNTAITLGQVIKRDNGASYQICTTAGTAGNGAEPAFSNTAGTTTADNTVTWTSLGAVGNFTGWQAPHARLANAFAANWGQAGNKFYIGDNHAETQATAMTGLLCPATYLLPSQVLCVDTTGSKPAVSADLRTTATISTTGASSMRLYSTGGHSYFYGIIFTAGSSTSNASIAPNFGAGSIHLKNCSLRLGGNNISGRIDFTNTAGRCSCVLENTTVSFANASQAILLAGYVRWLNTASALLGTVPSNLFQWGGNMPEALECIGVDFSSMSTGTIVANSLVGAAGSFARFIDCKLHASVTRYAAPQSPNTYFVDFTRTGASGINYGVASGQFSGDLVEELTVVRTGGASDGTTTIAWNITTNANCSWLLPFEALPIYIWNDTTGSSITATIQGIWAGGAVPNNDEIWVEVEYLGSGSSPQGSFVNDSKADVLAAAAGQTAGSGTWGGSTTKFELAVSFTPQQKGWIAARVKAGKASSTFYIDPKITLT
ncbi:hypothetical protein FJW04_24100 [Mesorhizobium sp. B2-7-3]|uniref:hypothetical protein n=1 Tax=Mesorhizobium sp. B2-7-3 TaxID=2589907 RepID=UPI00112EEBFE|nr:hypothetical protein [Mesorhizobium sp. B2-7-3]TPJ11443.1 hypothetical protein FJW04_24100 [Mesorhizobium sp. B2-7-3]